MAITVSSNLTVLGSNPSRPAIHIRVWESLVIRSAWNRENTGSNPVALTKIILYIKIIIVYNKKAAT